MVCSYKKMFYSTLLIVGATTGIASAQVKYQYPFQDPSLPITTRVDDLVGRLTDREKVSQTTLTAAAIPRLNIPEYTWWNESLHGLARSGPATVFPQAIGMGATWDAPLMEQVGDTISTEARSRYRDAIAHNNRSIFFGLTLWSPNINIFRDPRWGRGQETYGEDPYLTSRLGVGFVEGVQGTDDRFYKAIATPKHFAVHSGPEPLRHEFDIHPSPQDLEATYLPAFRATITEAKAASIMCAYNSIDGEPACADPELLQHVLRENWGFKGFVTSDCFAITNIWKAHHYAPDEEHAAAVSLKAGTDTSCGQEYASLNAALRDKLISETDLDIAVKRLFYARFRLGMFDPPESLPFHNLTLADVDSPDHRSFALKVSHESIVLLKNENGILPLKSVKSIAVVGPNAVELAALEGNYNGQPSHPILPLDGMIAEFGKQARISFSEGAEHVTGFAMATPRTVFRDGARHEGLKGEYFNNQTMQGKPVATRTDHEISFDWNALSPAPGVDQNDFSVLWTGTLEVPAAGDYIFKTVQTRCFYSCKTSEHYRVLIDGKELTNSGVTRQSAIGGETIGTGGSFTMHFTDTKPHQFRFEYSHKSMLFGAGLVFQWEPPADVLLAQAVRNAKAADVVVAFMGLSPRLEGEEFPIKLDGFTGGDRTKMDLPASQQVLLEALAQTGKPLIVVLENGSALAVPWIKEHASALIEAWYPGQSGGEAIADVLAGKYDPAGRLPVTMYASDADLPPFTDYSMKGRTYRYFTGKPLYGFGYGLSYTSFSYSNLKLNTDKIRAGDPLTATVEVTNTGKVHGEEVAELYLVDNATGVRLRLAAFQRFPLAPGASKRIQFTLDSRQLSDVDASGSRDVRPGNYDLYIGGSQPDEAQTVHTVYRVIGTSHLNP